MTYTKKIEYGERVDKDFDVRKAMEEASRCLLCEDAPCSQDCPAGTDPAKFIRSIRFNNAKGAAETIRENNVLGGVCSMVCPYDTLCEKACSRTGIDEPIQIGKLQKFAVDQEKALCMNILKEPEKELDKKVACIGSGPSSLACAAKLRQKGLKVTVFEQNEKLGGVLTYGITPSRLPQEVVDYDIDNIKKTGVKFETNRKIEANELEKLKEDYDAIFIGVGLWDYALPQIEGTDLEGVEAALDFLKEARENDGKIELGEEILVIGGGDVAIDCSTTCKQLGKNVSIVYRRTIEEAPANRGELDYLWSLGIPIYTRFAPEKILGENGKVKAMEFKSMKNDSNMTMEADQVIFATGQKLEKAYSKKDFGSGIFIGGDAKDGGSTVVESVASGKEAADQILDYLNL